MNGDSYGGHEKTRSRITGLVERLAVYSPKRMGDSSMWTTMETPDTEVVGMSALCTEISRSFPDGGHVMDARKTGSAYG